MDTAITMNTRESLVQLLHLISPNLPTGAFSYSQGLEWAVEAGWVHDGPSMQAWLTDLVEQSITFVDIPILGRMYNTVASGQVSELDKWCSMLLACRETSELREEEHTRGRALAILLQNLGVAGANHFGQTLRRSQLAGFAFTAVKWEIALRDAAMGYTWSWLENQVVAGVKIIPLGQTEGQRLLLHLSATVSETVEHGLHIKDKDIGSATPAMAIACSLHENQYTRLYRS